MKFGLPTKPNGEEMRPAYAPIQLAPQFVEPPPATIPDVMWIGPYRIEFINHLPNQSK